ncbi:helix-turn-helix domain-containing protein [Candidatus Poribacteria bacterium]|nr:helix-turn-helix domain-containing protein [Candidatus Poribacteria bacterium]
MPSHGAGRDRRKKPIYPSVDGAEWLAENLLPAAAGRAHSPSGPGYGFVPDIEYPGRDTGNRGIRVSAYRLTNADPAAVARFRLEVICAALRFQHRSPGRGNAVRFAEARIWIHPAGRLQIVHQATIYKWIRKYESGGLDALKPKTSRGKRLYEVSRKWDQSVPFDPRLKARIGTLFRRQIATILAVQGEVSRRNMKLWGTAVLEGYTLEAGYNPGRAFLKEICRVDFHMWPRPGAFNRSKMGAPIKLCEINHDQRPLHATTPADSSARKPSQIH